jgi:hypothetical protein
MAEVQPDATASRPRSPSAERMARCRQRRRNGMRCLTIELREAEVDALIRHRLLGPDDRNNRPAVLQALYHFLDEALR